jgi:TolB-like protein
MRLMARDLKDRKVVQWGLAYVAGSWLVLQVVDVVAEVWPLSIPLQQGFQILLVAGLPFVLVLAWYHGERGTQRVSGTELLMLAALLTIAGGVLAIWHGGGLARELLTDAPAAAGIPAAVGPGHESIRDRSSVAVLPFVDMSPERDQEYFGDGMAEEILHALARVPGLRVAARTSAFSFRGSAVDIRTIGERLGVASVLEGSVRREGNRVRVTAQLIGAADGFHIWSEEYDRELAGVVAVQEEIARAIVAALRIQLGDEAQQDEPWFATTNTVAYQAVLRGRHAIHSGNTRGALEWFTRATQADSTFAPARAGLAAAVYMAGFFGLRPFQETMAAARREALRALELDDRLAGPHAILSAVSLHHDRDWATAEREALRALELDPNDAIARHVYADFLTVMGDPEGAVRQLELGRQADPLSPLANIVVCAHVILARRFEDGLAELDAFRDRFPDSGQSGAPFRAVALWHLGRPDEAVVEFRRRWSRDPDLARTVEAALEERGAVAAMRAWGDHTAARYPAGGYSADDIASIYARAGATEEALKWLERAVETPSPVSLHLAASPDLDPLRDLPRFRALMAEMGIPQ